MGCWLALEVRRRWRSLVVLGLLVAFSAAVVLAAVAGAVRGVTATDRLSAATGAATVAIRPFASDDRFWSMVRAMDDVAALTTFPAAAFAVDDRPDTLSGLTLPPADADLFRTIETPVVLEGRLPDPGRLDEVVVTSQYGKHPGDLVTLRLLTPTQAVATNRVGGGVVPRGPVVPARVVGVVRSAWFADDPGGRGGVIASPALLARYRANLLGPPEDEGIPIVGLARLTGGSAAIDAFRGRLNTAAGMDVDVQDIDATLTEHRRRVDRTESTSLLIFGAAAAVAALVLVGQALSRYTTTATAELTALRAAGLTVRQHVAAASAAPTLAGAVGAVVAVGGAVAASYWMPIGSAALHEPAPGVHADPRILLPGALLTMALTAAGSAASAWAAQAGGSSGTGRPSAAALAAAQIGLPVPVITGVRFALEPGRGPTAVAVRPALAGAVAGVLGVVATLTFSAGVSEAAGNPARFGQTQQVEIYLGFGGQDSVAARPLLETIARDPAVAGVNDSRSQWAESQGLTFVVLTHNPVGDPLPSVLSQGRLPAGVGEIALGTATAANLRAQVGSRIVVTGATPRTLTVTGIGFVLAGLQNTYTEGGWMTADGYEDLFAGAPLNYLWHVGHIAFTPGADQDAALARLHELVVVRDQVGFVPPVARPGEIAEIGDVAVLPILLGVFLAVLATGAVGHALSMAVRRRRHEVAILRALGLTRPQARQIVFTHAAVLAAVALALGLPLGVALGQAVWRFVAETTPLQYVPPSTQGTLWLVIPATLLLAALLAAAPSRTAARLRVAEIGTRTARQE
ncbi:FtsX-like permease family protein [Herbidospora sp. RD11066]